MRPTDERTTSTHQIGHDVPNWALRITTACNNNPHEIIKLVTNSMSFSFVCVSGMCRRPLVTPKVSIYMEGLYNPMTMGFFFCMLRSSNEDLQQWGLCIPALKRPGMNRMSRHGRSCTNRVCVCEWVGWVTQTPFSRIFTTVTFRNPFYRHYHCVEVSFISLNLNIKRRIMWMPLWHVLLSIFPYFHFYHQSVLLWVSRLAFFF